MGTLEVFTIGGGSYIVNTFNAIAAWTGGGGYHSMLRVCFVLGLTYAVLIMAFNFSFRPLLHWFMTSALIYLCLMVPTVTVKVTDRIDPSLAPAVVDHVPLGLGLIANFTSQIGDYLTTAAETVFAMPSALQYNSNGFIYGARMYASARTAQITDPVLNANVTEYLKNCTFPDIMTNDIDINAITSSTNVWGVMGPGSPGASFQYLQAGSPPQATIMPCNTGYGRLTADWNTVTPTMVTKVAHAMFPTLSPIQANTKFGTDLETYYNTLTGNADSAITIMQQHMVLNAFINARYNFGTNGAGSSIDSLANARADIQAENSYNAIGTAAMKWVPLLNNVLTIIFYAMFPVIFPLFLLPGTGVAALKGYTTGFFYLASWGPLFAILHMILMSRGFASGNAAAPGGISYGSYTAMRDINNDTGLLAGYLIASVPFLAAGMAKGALAISGQATSFLQPTQSAAEAAAQDQTTGNTNYGNISLATRAFDNRTAHQWNDAESHLTGSPVHSMRNEDGGLVSSYGDGRKSYDAVGNMSKLPFSPSLSHGFATETAKLAREAETQSQSLRHQVADIHAFTASNATAHNRSVGSSSGQQSEQGARGGTDSSVSSGTSLSTNQANAKSKGVAETNTLSDSTDHRQTGYIKGDVGANVTVGTPLGGLAGSSASASASVAAGYERAHVTNQGANKSLASNHATSQTNTANAGESSETRNLEHDGSFYQNGHFQRHSNEEVQSWSQEKRDAYTQSATNEASRLHEVSKTLETSAREVESHGISGSTNLTEDFVRYYDAERAKNPDLNLPSLDRWNQAQGTQAIARDAAVQRWENAYIDKERALVSIGDPARALDLSSVAGPSSAHRTLSSQSGLHPLPASHGNAPDAIPARVVAGRHKVQDAVRAAQDEGARADVQGAAIDKTVRNGGY